MAEQGVETEVADFKIILRDISEPLVLSWRDNDAFGPDIFRSLIEVMGEIAGWVYIGKRLLFASKQKAIVSLDFLCKIFAAATFLW